MKFILCSIFYVIIFSTFEVFGDDTDVNCGNEYTNLEKCYLSELNLEVEEKANEYKKKVGGCFLDTKKTCTPPDLDHDPLLDLPRFIRKIGDKIKDEWANTSSTVKECIKKNITGEVAKIMNGCLVKRGVSQMDVSQFAQVLADEGGTDLLAALISDNGNGNGSQAVKTWKTFLLGRMNIARAFRECDDQHKNSTNATTGLNRCVRSVFGDAKKHFCQETAGCRKKTSQSCLKRAERVYESVCDCKYEKILEMIDRLDTYRKKGNVTIQEMMKSMSSGTGEDARKYIRAIDDCYAKNKQKTPSIIRLIEELSENMDSTKNSAVNKKTKARDTNSDKDLDPYDLRKVGGNSQSPGAVVDVSIINTIRDFLASQAFDRDECVSCPRK